MYIYIYKFYFHFFIIYDLMFFVLFCVKIIYNFMFLFCRIIAKWIKSNVSRINQKSIEVLNGESNLNSLIIVL